MSTIEIVSKIEALKEWEALAAEAAALLSADKEKPLARAGKLIARGQNTTQGRVYG